MMKMMTAVVDANLIVDVVVVVVVVSRCRRGVIFIPIVTIVIVTIVIFISIITIYIEWRYAGI